MAHTPTPGYRSLTAFRALAVAALVSAFAQVTLGGIVRVTGSGLGCPDWPFCHGKLIPPLNDIATMLEYSHRLSASVLGILVLGLFITAVMRYRRNRWAMNSTATALALVVVASLLGGATVLTELVWWIRLVHLAIAMGVVAALVIAAAVGWRIGGDVRAAASAGGASARFSRLTIVAIAGVFLLILSGSYIVGAGYGSSCGTWPLCRGSLLPEGRAYLEHMSHRYFAALVGVAIAAVAVGAWRQRLSAPSIGRGGLLLAVAFALQILAGALTVWMGFTPAIKAVHLSMATLVWIALVFVAALAIALRRFEHPQAAGVAAEASRMEGLQT